MKPVSRLRVRKQKTTFVPTLSLGVYFVTQISTNRPPPFAKWGIWNTHVYFVHVHEVYAHVVHAYKVHACGVHAYEMHAHETHARNMHAYEMNAREVYSHEMYARDMHTRKVLGKTSKSPTLQTVVRWSICRDLSCKIRVFAPRDSVGCGCRDWLTATPCTLGWLTASQTCRGIANCFKDLPGFASQIVINSLASLVGKQT
jgi:hypothetical protein